MRFTLLAVLFGIGFTFHAQEKAPISAARISSEERLNSLLDAWHKNATLAQFEAYFAATSEDFVFYGTAPAEKWDKTGFMAFCKPYFDSGKT
ncbi:MAG: nuclear transport factor 2 family protein, partial [Bacteroidota bacterium]